ncbi:MAG: hypothetical protein HQM09_00710 [Candidatus Riflebacteria bacterium]|nr:hypothetical protein [Candidatus Riflebacteria bacterium]
MRGNIGTLFAVTLIAIVMIFTPGCSSKPGTTGPALKVDSFTVAQGLPGNHITALAVFGSQIWVGTKNGLARHDGVNWQVHVKKNTNALGSEVIEALAVGDNTIYIATENGVTKFDGTTWGTIMTGVRARGVAAKGNEIAVATAHGVEYSTGAEFQPFGKENAGLCFGEVNTVVFDTQKRLWAGTRAGLGLFSGGAFQNQTGPAKSVMGNSLVNVPASPLSCQLPGNNILCMLPWKGQMALGTTSGFALSDLDKSWSVFTAAHKDWVQKAGSIVEEMTSGNSPMPGNAVTALAAMGDTILFVGTNKGVVAKSDASWIDLQSAIPALSGKAITALATEKDALWAGTSDALYKIDGISSLVNQSAGSK